MALKMSKRMFRFFGAGRELFADALIFRGAALLSFLFVLATATLAWWKIVPLAETAPFIPLHYNVYLGVDRFGSWRQAFTLPAIGLGLLLVNLGFEAVFFRSERMLAYFFALATLVSEIVLFVSMILLVLLNL